MRVDSLPCGEITMSDVSNLAGANEIVERFESFMLRRFGIGLMNLIQVDIVSSLIV